MPPSWRRHGPRIAYGLLLLLALAWEAGTLFTSTTLVRAAGRQPFAIQEFSSGVPVGQTFRMLSDGLQSVDVVFSADRGASLVVRCQLLTWEPYAQDGWAVLFEWAKTIQLSPGSQWQQFVFQPIPRSAMKVYQFRVQQHEVHGLDPNGPDDRPRVSVVGSMDDSLKEGNLILGGFQWVDRDLFFKAHGADGAFTAFRLLDQTGLPTRLRRASVQLALLALYNLVLAVFAYELIVRAPEHEERGRS
jgi:hypothetical protein